MCLVFLMVMYYNMYNYDYKREIIMPINVTTVYTKERLLRLSNFVQQSRLWFWIITAVASLLVIAIYFFAVFNDFVNFEITFWFCVVLFFDVFYMFLIFVLPRLMIKKAKNVGTVLEFSFNEENFLIHAVNEHVDESATVKYSMVTKVCNNRDDVYLFISPRQAYIVDLGNSSYEDQVALKRLLQDKVAPGRFKW